MKQFSSNYFAEVYVADWKIYGKSAGPRRNQKMLDDGKPTIVIAFHNDIDNSKGTADMIARAKKLGIPTEILTEDSMYSGNSSDENC